MLIACTSNAPMSGKIPDAVPKVEPKSPYGNPRFYFVDGRRYDVLASSKGYVERGIASWYGPEFHGRRASSGELYDMYAMTAAHPTLPLPTYVQVTDLENGRKAIVKVNDRGPFHDGRVIDLSYAAARKLGILQRGTALVEVRALDPRHTKSPRAPTVAKATQAAPPGLFVQVGTFSDIRNAEQLRARLVLNQLGRINIHPDAEIGKPLYRVRIGPLSSVDAADLTAQRLESMGLNDIQVIVE